MTEDTSTETHSMDRKEVPAKELLLISIPVSIIFAVSGMDFIGYFIYLATRTSPTDIYSRSLLNVLIGFLISALSLFLIPFIVNKIRWKKPLSYFGNQFGNKKIGLIVVLIFVLFTPLIYLISRDQNLINTYPLTKDVLGSWFGFALYELSYILFYYISYEFFFRGILQLGLSKSWKKWQSILFVTLLTTVLHITKPYTEIIAALIGGILFGILAEKTKSWFYVFVLHITSGILIDIFCALRYLGMI